MTVNSQKSWEKEIRVAAIAIQTTHQKKLLLAATLNSQKSWEKEIRIVVTYATHKNKSNFKNIIPTFLVLKVAALDILTETSTKKLFILVVKVAVA